MESIHDNLMDVATEKCQWLIVLLFTPLTTQPIESAAGLCILKVLIDALLIPVTSIAKAVTRVQSEEKIVYIAYGFVFAYSFLICIFADGLFRNDLALLLTHSPELFQVIDYARLSFYFIFASIALLSH